MNRVRKQILDVLLYIRKNKKEYKRIIECKKGSQMQSVAGLVRERTRQFVKCSNRQDLEQLQCNGFSIQAKIVKEFVSNLPEDAYLEFDSIEDYDGYFNTRITAVVEDFESDEEYLTRLLKLKESFDEVLKRSLFKTRSTDNEVNLYIVYLESLLENKEQ